MEGVSPSQRDSKASVFGGLPLYLSDSESEDDDELLHRAESKIDYVDGDFKMKEGKKAAEESDSKIIINTEQGQSDRPDNVERPIFIKEGIFPSKEQANYDLVFGGKPDYSSSEDSDSDYCSDHEEQPRKEHFQINQMNDTENSISKPTQKVATSPLQAKSKPEEVKSSPEVKEDRPDAVERPMFVKKGTFAEPTKDAGVVFGGCPDVDDLSSSEDEYSDSDSDDSVGPNSPESPTFHFTSNSKSKSKNLSSSSQVHSHKKYQASSSSHHPDSHNLSSPVKLNHDLPSLQPLSHQPVHKKQPIKIIPKPKYSMLEPHAPSGHSHSYTKQQRLLKQSRLHGTSKKSNYPSLSTTSYKKPTDLISTFNKSKFRESKPKYSSGLYSNYGIGGSKPTNLRLPKAKVQPNLLLSPLKPLKKY